MNSSHYYISSGAQSKYHTLRYVHSEPRYIKDERGVHCVGEELKDEYVCMLSIKKDEAIAKAINYLKSHGVDESMLSKDVNVEIVKKSSAHDINWSIFRKGKYIDKSILEIVNNDFSYCVWFAMNNHCKNAEYLKTIQSVKDAIEIENKKREENVKSVHEKNDNEVKSLLASTHIGTIGEKTIFTGIVEQSFSFDSSFGVGYCTVFNCSGNIVVWFNRIDAEIGERIVFNAIVKDHAIRKRWIGGVCVDYKQTVVKNVKISK